MKKALIIYYSQTGQLKKIVDFVTSPLRDDFELIFEELKPVPPYPFPWQRDAILPGFSGIRSGDTLCFGTVFI